MMHARGWVLGCLAVAAVPAAACGFQAGESASTSSSTTDDAGTSTTSASVGMTLDTSPTLPTLPTSGSSPNATSTGGEVDTTDASSTAEAQDESTGSDATSGDASGSSSTSGAAPGLGDIMGDCGVLVAGDFESAAPQFIVNAIDFGEVGFDYEQLTTGGQEVYDDGNLGGSSLLSEVIAFEVLGRCEGVSLLKTEAEIIYDDESGPKTDLLVDSYGVQVGVSVTRAVAFPFDDPYPTQAATTLLEDKLAGVLSSTANVSVEDGWPKQILHILAYAPMHAEVLEAAYAEVDTSLRADTIVWVTVTNGDDLFVYD